jgi:hypothetical protein
MVSVKQSTKGRATFLIIGAGKFGAKAAERLHSKRPGARLTIVDQNMEALSRLSHLQVEQVCHEGGSLLKVFLDTEPLPEWIIPAVPIHLAFEWVRLKMSEHGCLEVFPVPAEIEAVLPNPVRGTDGQLFISYADFVCPDNCVEPFDRCTFTGKPRKGLLYKKLEGISYRDFTSVVIRSHQLAPGVGGYRPEALKESLGKIVESKGPVLYSTACLCHGVIHAFTIS